MYGNLAVYQVWGTWLVCAHVLVKIVLCGAVCCRLPYSGCTVQLVLMLRACISLFSVMSLRFFTTAVDPAKRDEYLARLMAPPNNIWGTILAQAQANPAVLQQQEVIKSLQNVLQTNVSVCSSLGHPYLSQMVTMADSMLQVRGRRCGRVLAKWSIAGLAAAVGGAAGDGRGRGHALNDGNARQMHPRRHWIVSGHHKRQCVVGFYVNCAGVGDGCGGCLGNSSCSC